MTSEGLRGMSRILDALLARGDSGPFREEVAWRELGLTDYLEIVKRPMDFGTIK